MTLFERILIVAGILEAGIYACVIIGNIREERAWLERRNR